MKGWRRFLGVLVVVLIAAVSVAACGSSSSSSKSASSTTTSATTTAPPPVRTGERARFIAAADAICRAGRVRVEQHLATFKQALQRIQAGNTAAARQELAQALDQLTATASTEVAQLRALPVPTAIRVEVERWFASEGSTLALARRFAAALRANNQAEIQALAREIQREGTVADGLARRIGLRVCTGPTG